MVMVDDYVGLMGFDNQLYIYSAGHILITLVLEFQNLF